MWPRTIPSPESPEGPGNDDRMRSLIEVSRASGIPMPVIARLQRERPDRLPAVRVGAALFFPEAIIPTLLELVEDEERGLEATSADRQDPASQPPQQGERRRAAKPPSAPEPTEAASDAVLRVPPSPPREQDSNPDYEALAQRIERLDTSLRDLSGQLADLTKRLRRPPSISIHAR